MARALTAQRPRDPALARVAAGALLWAWQEDPLHPEVTAALLGLDAAMPFLPRQVRELARP
jgi:hypothetical protein